MEFHILPIEEVRDGRDYLFWDCSMCRNLQHVFIRDGVEKAIAFAAQAVKAYRRAILSRPGMVSDLRRGMIEAYLCAKAFRACEQGCEWHTSPCTTIGRHTIHQCYERGHRF